MIKKLNGIVLFVFCLLAGIFISLQLNIVQNSSDGKGLIPIYVAKSYEEQLGIIRADKEKAKQRLAEAISINGQRIIATTEFNYVNHALYINKLPTAPPYIIKATGNPDTLESLINIRYGILDTMKSQYGLLVRLEKKDRIEIPRYRNYIKYKYANPEEEREIVQKFHQHNITKHISFAVTKNNAKEIFL